MKTKLILLICLTFLSVLRLYPADDNSFRYSGAKIISSENDAYSFDKSGHAERAEDGQRIGKAEGVLTLARSSAIILFDKLAIVKVLESSKILIESSGEEGRLRLRLLEGAMIVVSKRSLIHDEAISIRSAYLSVSVKEDAAFYVKREEEGSICAVLSGGLKAQSTSGSYDIPAFKELRADEKGVSYLSYASKENFSLFMDTAAIDDGLPFVDAGLLIRNAKVLKEYRRSEQYFKERLKVSEGRQEDFDTAINVKVRLSAKEGHEAPKGYSFSLEKKSLAEEDMFDVYSEFEYSSVYGYYSILPAVTSRLLYVNAGGKLSIPFIYKGEKELNVSYEEGYVIINGNVYALIIKSAEDIEKLRPGIKLVVLAEELILGQKQQKQIAQYINEQAAGLKTVNYTATSLSIISMSHNSSLLDLSSTGFSDNAHKYISPLTNLRVLNVSYTGASSNVLRAATSLPKLRILSMEGSRINDSGLAYIEGAKGLMSLNISANDISDAGLSKLTSLKELRELKLAGTRVSDFGLLMLSASYNLRSLNLSGCRVSDQGLIYLQNLSNVISLNLSSTIVSAAALKRLKGMRRLRMLDLSKSAVSGEAVRVPDTVRYLSCANTQLRSIDGNGGLRILNIDSCPISVASAALIAKNEKLLSLSAEHTKNAKEILKEVKGLDSIRSLDLSFTGIDAKDLKHIKVMTGLRQLNLSKTGLNDYAVKDLSGLIKLRSLSLAACSLTDESAYHLRGMADLRALDLSYNDVTEFVFEYLRGMADLRYVNLSKSYTSENAKRYARRLGIIVRY